MTLDTRDIALLAHLRSGKKRKVTDISRVLNIPATTLYDRLGLLESGLGIKYTALVDFQKLGYMRVVHLCIKAQKENKNRLEQHLLAHKSLNSLVRINHGYDFLAHMVFRDVGELRQFVDDLDARFGAEIQVFEAIDEIVRERFMSKSGFG